MKVNMPSFFRAFEFQKETAPLYSVQPEGLFSKAPEAADEVRGHCSRVCHRWQGKDNVLEAQSLVQGDLLDYLLEAAAGLEDPGFATDGTEAVRTAKGHIMLLTAGRAVDGRKGMGHTGLSRCWKGLN
jgi:hypothetical protein